MTPNPYTVLDLHLTLTAGQLAVTFVSGAVLWFAVRLARAAFRHDPPTTPPKAHE